MVREEAEAGLRLASACCVAYILTNYGVRITKDTAATLMKALLLKPDVANQKCADYEQLVNVYLVSEKWRRSVFTSIFHHHHIRFWYLWCCGCPGLRGRQHLAMPHTRSP